MEDLHSLLAEEKGLTFEIFAGTGADLTRLGDSHRVRQILHNLVGNAVKFTERGEVTVKVSGKKEQPIVFVIKDTGIGMNQQQVSELYEEFTQGDNSVTRRFGGTGLGMSITRKLVNLMGGKIDVVSMVGHGTTITVTLPLPMSESYVSDRKLKSSGYSIDGLRILAADDNETNREVIETMLVYGGAEVTIVNDGQQAVNAWSARPYDVVILDVAMPVMDGISALKRIRELESSSDARAVPIVALTADAMSHQVAEYLIAGFDACVTKPVNLAILTKLLRTLVR